MSREDSTRKGVSDAWDFWLSQHDVSVPETIFAAVEKAVRGWLDDNTDALIAAIADKYGMDWLDIREADIIAAVAAKAGATGGTTSGSSLPTP